jgi:hypothetical protein
MKEDQIIKDIESLSIVLKTVVSYLGNQSIIGADEANKIYKILADLEINKPAKY